MKRGDHALDRVVEQHRTHARVGQIALGLVEVRRAEKWLVLPNGLALVVEDRPARANPACQRIREDDRAILISKQLAGDSIALRRVTWLGLHLRLDLAIETVRVGEADLDSSLWIGVRFTRERCGERRLTSASKPIQIIENSSGCLSEQTWRLRERS
jgi:hypothetical protein